jgi:hypothetical protein
MFSALLLLLAAPLPVVEPVDRGQPEAVALAAPEPTAVPTTPATRPLPPAASPTSRHTEAEPMFPSAAPSGRDDLVVSDRQTIRRNLGGVGIGYENGLVGQAFGQGLKIDAPFGRGVGGHFGVRVRAGFVHTGTREGQAYDPVVTSGIDFFGRGPLMHGIVRVYGGGGPRVGLRPDPRDGGRSWHVGGGGQLGVEFLLGRRVTAQFEVGGQSGGHARGLDSGATVQAGCMVYLGGLGDARSGPRALAHR